MSGLVLGLGVLWLLILVVTMAACRLAALADRASLPTLEIKVRRLCEPRVHRRRPGALVP